MLKAYSLDLRERVACFVDADQIWQAIGDICNLYSPTECQNYFKAAGYAST